MEGIDEAVSRSLAHSLSAQVASGQMSFGGALILCLLLGVGIAVLTYACKEAKQGKPGWLIASIVAGVLLMIFMLNSCQ